jgi:hypothetical protein
MAGVGRIFKRKQKLADGRVVEDPIWHIAFYHRAKSAAQPAGQPTKSRHESFSQRS